MNHPETLTSESQFIHDMAGKFSASIMLFDAALAGLKSSPAFEARDLSRFERAMGLLEDVRKLVHARQEALQK